MQTHVRNQAPTITTTKAKKEAENAAAIGGMRNPATAVGRIPGLKTAGAKVRKAIADYCVSHPQLLRDVVHSAGVKSNCVEEARIDDLAAHIAEAIGAPHHRRGHRSLWRPGIVKAFIELAGDPDDDLARWLDDGAPTGVAEDVLSSGIFPATEVKGANHAELWRHWAHLEPRANYASVEDHADLVKTEIDRLRAAGFITVYPDWNAVQARFGHVVVSKMAAIVKDKADGTKKLRLIIDMRRSQVNAHARVHERIVLPRIVDMLTDALAIQAGARTDDDLDMIVLDWADAFHSMGVAPSEFAHQIVKGFNGEFIGYETVLFGGAGSPTVWGRAAAFLGRSGQALFSATEVRLQVYVDDPWSIWLGDPNTRARNFGYLLLWWRVLGPPVSWKKIQVGKQVKWIGIHISILNGGIDLEMDPDFLDDLVKDIVECSGAAPIPAAKLRRVAGKAEWAAGLIPYLKSMVSPLWAALADAPFETIGANRVAHSLRWLLAFFRGRRGTMTRHFRHDDAHAAGQVVIDVDASPWGFGGVIYVNGAPHEYFSDPISQEDVDRFGITVGSPKDQALLETIALLIAVRLWKVIILRQVWTVTVRTDSTAAMGAACRLRSPDPRMNTVIREMALDLAEGLYELDFFEHVAGVLNELPDVLSRWAQPGVGETVPRALAQAARKTPERRVDSWWAAAQDPRLPDGGPQIKKRPPHPSPRGEGGTPGARHRGPPHPKPRGAGGPPGAAASGDDPQPVLTGGESSGAGGPGRTLRCRRAPALPLPACLPAACGPLA